MDFTSLFDNFSKPELPFPCMELFLDITKAHESLNENCKPILEYLETSLRKTKSTDLRPLYALKNLVNQCAPELFVQHCIKWTEKLVKIIQVNENEDVVKMACEIFVEILPYVEQNSELNRQFTTTVVPKLLAVLLKSKSDVHQIYKLKCLKELMLHFRGPCRRLFNDLEKCILDGLFTNDDFNLQHQAASCLVLLPALGAVELAQNVSQAWEDYINKILGSLNDIITILFERIPDERIWKLNESVTFDMHDLTEGIPVVKFQKLHQRFHTLCFCLCEILRTSFPSTTNVSLDDIIGFISQIITVTPNSFKNYVSTDDLMLISILPFLHEDALKVLEAVTEMCRKHLLPYVGTVCKLLNIGFEWTIQREIDGNNNKPLSGLRCQVFSTLQIWSEIMSSSSGLDYYYELFLQHIINDLKNSSKKVQLQTAAEEQNRRKRKRGQTFASVGSIGPCKDNPLNNDQLCINALKALKSMHYAVGPTLKTTVYKEICSFVVRLAYEVFQNTDSRPAPYDNPKCRKELVSVLLSLVLLSPRGTGSPMQMAFRLFTLGSNDANREVSVVCSEAKLTCMQLIHPRFPSLQFNLEPVEKEVVKQTQSITLPKKFTVIAEEKIISSNKENQITVIKKVEKNEEVIKEFQTEDGLIMEDEIEDEPMDESDISEEHVVEEITITTDDETNENTEKKSNDLTQSTKKSTPNQVSTKEVCVQALIETSPTLQITIGTTTEDLPQISPQPQTLEPSKNDDDVEKRANNKSNSEFDDVLMLSSSPETSPKKRKINSNDVQIISENDDVISIPPEIEINKSISQVGEKKINEESQLTVEEMLKDFVNEEKS